MTVSQKTKYNVTKLRDNGVITEKQLQGGLHRSKLKVYGKWVPDIRYIVQEREGWG